MSNNIPRRATSYQRTLRSLRTVGMINKKKASPINTETQPRNSNLFEELKAVSRVMQDMFSNDVQKSAFEALDECPFSINKFKQLCASLREADLCESETLSGTLRFVRTQKLPKAKTLSWLAKYGITSDSGVIMKLWAPLLTQMAPYYLRLADAGGAKND